MRIFLFLLPLGLLAQPTPRAEWGAPLVDVSRSGSVWTIAGRKNTVTLNAEGLGLQIRTADQTWTLVPAKSGGIRIKSGGREFDASLSEAKSIDIARFDTGARTGLKLTLRGWEGAPGLVVYLTAALQGEAEDLVFDAAADETHGAIVRRLDWPEALDAANVDDTVLSNIRGVLLPRNYPQTYNPIRDADPNGNPDTKSEVQSNIIEDWSMSWWGFDRGKASLMVIVETPDDAAYQFSHPAGGPTVIGPRWRESLGKLGYLRKCRLCFLSAGGYVAMAKRYRQYAIDTGLFVSLREKVARSPRVARLIGVPMFRARILTNFNTEGDDYKRLPDKSAAHRLTPFAVRAEQLRKMKAQGIDALTVVATGWPHLGYDRQHPDALPPSSEAGGWPGLKTLSDTCGELGFLFSLHDQYRDYYVDAPSFNTEFAIHEEDAVQPANEFPGSRFGDFKEGVVPYMDHWEGGKMSYLNPRLMLEHLEKNYQAMFDHAIYPQGSYIDVFGYVPPDEDFNPEHPTTRTDGRLARIDCFNWCRAHLGFVGTEAGCDWTVPYVDFSSPEQEHKGVSLPLFNLVYHDAVMTPYDVNDLHGFLNAGLPQLSSRDRTTGMPKPEDLAAARRMAALQRRLAFVEMTNHEFLNQERSMERTSFADGTTVTVDWPAKSVQIVPER